LVLLLYFSVFCLLYGLTPGIIGALTFGWYLSLIIEVPARQLFKLRFLSYPLSVAISTFLVFSLLILGIGSIFPIVLDEGKKLFPLLKESVGSLGNLSLLPNLGESRLGQEAVQALRGAGGNILEKTTQLGVEIVNALVRSLPDFTTGLVVFVITAGYFTYTVPVFKKNLWRFFPASSYEKAHRFVAEVYGDIRHFIAGQILIALFIGLVVGTGLALVGLPYAMFLGFISGITNFIPYLGVLVAAIPSIVLGLSHQGWIGILKVVIVLAAANQIEGWFLSPRIQGSRMKLNWFVIILSILVSGSIFGLVGILIAIPLLVFFKKFWQWYVQDFFSRI
jgi:predicted PurR-regulated permease PerM